MADTSRLPSIDEFANAEHCVLEDEAFNRVPPTTMLSDRQARDLRHDTTIRDGLRGGYTRIQIYAEGLADIETKRRGKDPTHMRYDLRFLDPVPKATRFQATGLFRTAGLMSGLSGLFTIAAIFGWLPEYFLIAGLAGFALTAITMFVGFVKSHEIIAFKTLHGRADVIRLRAGLGTIGRFQVLVAKLVAAIGTAAESVHEETSVYLRAEMREHYRLRGDGVLTDEQCAASTGKILNDFDGSL